MTQSLKGNTITLTRGDTFKAVVTPVKRDGSTYKPVEGDSFRFAAKRDYLDPRVLIEVDIPIDTMLLELKPEHTKFLDFGEYVYDIQLTKANGDVDTFIAKQRLRITEEVV